MITIVATIVTLACCVALAAAGIYTRTMGYGPAPSRGSAPLTIPASLPPVEWHAPLTLGERARCAHALARSESWGTYHERLTAGLRQAAASPGQSSSALGTVASSVALGGAGVLVAVSRLVRVPAVALARASARLCPSRRVAAALLVLVAGVIAACETPDLSAATDAKIARIMVQR